MTSKASKPARGTIRNIANQLAQIAAGWEAAFDGPVLLAEPTAGSYVIDLVQKVSTFNNRPADLGMTSVLDEWLQTELARLRRDRDWISEARVEVQYEHVPSEAFMDSNPCYLTSQAFVARLSATVRVATSDGAAVATFRNVHAVTGQVADPARPKPQHYLPTGPRKPQRDA